MTEKRFVRRYAGRTIKKLIGIEDIETNRVCVTIEENICLLNELADENKEFKEKNEQLKQTIKEVLELLKEEVDLFSDKAIEHDIQAYIELGELDNKDAYYMAISTKKAIKLLREMII